MFFLVLNTILFVLLLSIYDSNDRNIHMFNQFLQVLLMLSFIFIMISVEIFTSPILFGDLFPKLMKNYQKYA